MSTFVRGEIWRFIAQRGRPWVTRSEVLLAFDMAPNTVTKQLSRLAEAGYLDVEGKTCSRRYRAVTKHGPPPDRRSSEFRDARVSDLSALERRRRAGKPTSTVRAARAKARRMLETAMRATALDTFWPSPVAARAKVL